MFTSVTTLHVVVFTVRIVVSSHSSTSLFTLLLILQSRIKLLLTATFPTTAASYQVQHGLVFNMKKPQETQYMCDGFHLGHFFDSTSVLNMSGSNEMTVHVLMLCEKLFTLRAA